VENLEKMLYIIICFLILIVYSYRETTKLVGYGSFDIYSSSDLSMVRRVKHIGALLFVSLVASPLFVYEKILHYYRVVKDELLLTSWWNLYTGKFDGLMVEGNEKLVELTKDMIVSEYHMTKGTFRGMMLRGFVGELRRRTGIDMDLFNEIIPGIKFVQFVWDGYRDGNNNQYEEITEGWKIISECDGDSFILKSPGGIKYVCRIDGGRVCEINREYTDYGEI
jgi:hypothetical protein